MVGKRHIHVRRRFESLEQPHGQVRLPDVIVVENAEHRPSRLSNRSRVRKRPVPDLPRCVGTRCGGRPAAELFPQRRTRRCRRLLRPRFLDGSAPARRPRPIRDRWSCMPRRGRLAAASTLVWWGEANQARPLSKISVVANQGFRLATEAAPIYHIRIVVHVNTEGGRAAGSSQRVRVDNVSGRRCRVRWGVPTWISGQTSSTRQTEVVPVTSALEMALRHQPLSISLLYRDREGAIDGIGDYCDRLESRLRAVGADARTLAWRSGRIDASEGTLVVQYNPFSFGRWGFAPRLPFEMISLKRRRPDVRQAVMVHEAFVSIDSAKSMLMGAWQRLQLRAVLSAADVVMVSTSAWSPLLPASCRPITAPVGSNLPDRRRASQRSAASRRC